LSGLLPNVQKTNSSVNMTRKNKYHIWALIGTKKILFLSPKHFENLADHYLFFAKGEIWGTPG